MRLRRLNLEDPEDVEVYRALASDVRVHILDLLAGGPMNINAMGQALGLSAPTVTHHIQALEHAGLLDTEYAQGTQGTQKLCLGRYDRFLLSMDSPLSPEEEVEKVEIPIGLYTTATPGGTCGLASPERIIGFYDDAQSFLLPERTAANILWMAEGGVEYVFPNRLPPAVTIDRMEVSMEICSEAPDFDNDYPSDITLWVNGIEIGTWRSPGDLGGKRGRMYPPWWPLRITQFGLLKTWTLSPGGCYIDGIRVSDVTLRDADVVPRKPVSIRIGVNEDAECAGGFNLLGRGIGNHDQDVVLRLFYSYPKEPRPA